MLTVQEVENAIGAKAPSWKGECYAVSMMILGCGLIKGKARYGHWLGPVRRGTMFYGRPIVQHGWIETKDHGKTIIVDATRWVFEGRKPYIFIGEDVHGYYDIGGSKLRQVLSGPQPKEDLNEEDITHKIPADIADLLTDLLGHKRLTPKGMFWIANQHPRIFGKWAQRVYRAIRKLKLQAFIPIDYQCLIEGRDSCR